MKKNRLREKFKANEPALGTRLLSVWPGMVEIIGNTGIFDYVEYLGEFSAWTMPDLENFARATELCNLSSMIKTDQNNRAFIAQRALGAGIQNILFCDIRTKEEAEQCVRIVRAETPDRGGLNGMASRRNVGFYGGSSAAEYVQAMDDAIVGIMIEKKEAVENLEDILSVPGIDMVQFGPNDYALSLGMPGENKHPKVRDAEIRMATLAIEKGIRPRVEIGATKYDLEKLKQFKDLGVMDFSMPPEGKIVFDWLQEHGKVIRKFLES